MGWMLIPRVTPFPIIEKNESIFWHLYVKQLQLNNCIFVQGRSHEWLVDQ